MTKQKTSGEQVRTARCSLYAIMRSAEFARGVADVRAGRAFDYERSDNLWAYERGRQFGCIAPTNMPLHIGGKINPKAKALYNAAHSRGYIR